MCGKYEERSSSIVLTIRGRRILRSVGHLLRGGGGGGGWVGVKCWQRVLTVQIQKKRFKCKHHHLTSYNAQLPKIGKQTGKSW